MFQGRAAIFVTIEKQLRTALDAEVEPLDEYVERFWPLFRRRKQAMAFASYVRGLLLPLPYNACEPSRWCKARTPSPYRILSPKWNEKPLQHRLWQSMAAAITNEMGCLIVDGSGFPKKGEHSACVTRQWLGGLGKVDNGQQGVSVGYGSDKGHSLAHCRLFMPKSGEKSALRRQEARIPAEIQHQPAWKVALPLIFGCRDGFGGVERCLVRLRQHLFGAAPSDARAKVHANHRHGLPDDEMRRALVAGGRPTEAVIGVEKRVAGSVFGPDLFRRGEGRFP